MSHLFRPAMPPGTVDAVAHLVEAAWADGLRTGGMFGLVVGLAIGCALGLLLTRSSR